MQSSLIRSLWVRLSLLVVFGLLPGRQAVGAEKKLFVDTMALGAEAALRAAGKNLKSAVFAVGSSQPLLAQADTGSSKKAAGNGPKVNVAKNGVILKGYDAVAYFKQKRAVKGDPKYSSSYGGATYYFASADDKAEFDETPAKYAPQYGGYCAYSLTQRKLGDVDPKVFLVYKGKLYVCSSPRAGKAFYSDPEANIKKADTNWQFYQPPSNPGLRRELGS